MTADLPSVAFYIVAHADDWQLFMNPAVFNDLTNRNTKVVFIITTAGDAGMGSAYWMAREEGCKSSMKYCLAPKSDVSEKMSLQMVGENPVACYSVNQHQFYFLRLPDGSLDGSGFPDHNHQSLAKLRDNKIQSINTVDDSTEYTWDKLCNTLLSLIMVESNGSKIDLHYINPDPATNPNDHADHKATGEAILSLRFDIPIRHHQYGAYGSQGENHLPDNEFFWKAGMFAVYEKAVFDACGYSTLKENPDLYIKWCIEQQDITIYDEIPGDSPIY